MGILNWFLGKEEETDDEEFERLVKEGKIGRENFNYQYREPKVLETIEGSFKDWWKFMEKYPRLVTYLGGRRTGKTAGAFNTGENLAKRKKRIIQAMGMEDVEFPPFIQNISNIEDVENDSVLLVGEGAISSNSRDSMSKTNRNIAKLLPILSHKEVYALWCSQAGFKVDKNIIFESDTVVLLKNSLMQLEKGGERPAVKALYKKYLPYIDKHIKNLGTEKGVAAIHSENFKGVIRFKLPTWFNDNISKSYKHKEIFNKGEE